MRGEGGVEGFVGCFWSFSFPYRFSSLRILMIIICLEKTKTKSRISEVVFFLESSPSNLIPPKLQPLPLHNKTSSKTFRSATQTQHDSNNQNHKFSNVFKCAMTPPDAERSISVISNAKTCYFHNFSSFCGVMASHVTMKNYSQNRYTKAKKSKSRLDNDFCYTNRNEFTQLWPDCDT
jgi:hypothetical protein